MNNAFRKFPIALIAALLVACGGEDEPLGFEAGPLGSVEVGAGEAVQIRSLLTEFDYWRGVAGRSVAQRRRVGRARLRRTSTVAPSNSASLWTACARQMADARVPNRSAPIRR